MVDCTLKLIFRNGTILYITYNNYTEYSYQLLYTKDKFDRERFDNYDKKWDVDTKPHHFHTKGENRVIRSTMTGELNEDIPKLVSFIQNRLNL